MIRYRDELYVIAHISYCYHLPAIVLKVTIVIKVIDVICIVIHYHYTYIVQVNVYTR